MGPGQHPLLLLHIADDGLPTIVDMDMFDADKLMTAMRGYVDVPTTCP